MRQGMKKGFVLFLTFALTIFIWLGQFSNVSANNTDTAEQVDFGKTYDISIDGGDTTYYTFTIPNNGNIDLHIIGEYATGTLLDPGGNKLMEITDDNGDSSNGSEASVGLPAGKYYLKIDNGYITDNVSFELNFTQTDNGEKEPNNDLVSSTNINLGQTYTGMLQSGSDDDNYQFTIPTAGNVKLSFSQAKDISWYVDLLDANKKVFSHFETDNSNEVKNDETTEVGLPAGTYYVHVDGEKSIDYSYENKMETTPYQLKVEFTAGNNFEKEPNNSLPNANNITLNQTYNADLQQTDSSNNDQDFYKFTLTSDSNVTLSLSQSDNAISYAILDEKKQYVSGNTDDSSTAAPHLNKTFSLKKGTYYLKVSVEYVDKNLIPYDFKLSASPILPVSSALKASQIKVANNKGKADTISVSGLKSGDTIKSYNSRGHLLATKKSTGTNVSLSVPQLGSTSGKIYVTVTHSGMKESGKTAVGYSGEPSSALKANQIKIKNNKHKSDTVTVSHLSKGDVIKIYNSKGKNIAKKTSNSSSATLYISQLGKGSGHIYATVTHSGMKESSKTYEKFSKEK